MAQCRPPHAITRLDAPCWHWTPQQAVSALRQCPLRWGRKLGRTMPYSGGKAVLCRFTGDRWKQGIGVSIWACDRNGSARSPICSAISFEIVPAGRRPTRQQTATGSPYAPWHSNGYTSCINAGKRTPLMTNPFT